VAPASGAVLLRLVLNCAAVYYADVQAEGCSNDDDEHTLGCAPTSDGTDNGKCTSELRLTVTPDAYFEADIEQAGRRRVQMGGDQLHHTVDTHAPIPGTVQRTDRIVIDRANVEAQVQAVWQATPVDQRTIAAPTLDEMLVSGTQANAMLGSLFTTEQQPHVVYPLSYSLDGSDECGHRRLQKGGDRLHVAIDTHAPSPLASDKAEQRLVDRLPGAELTSCRPSPPPPAPHGLGSCDLATRTKAVNDECCDEPTEDCSSGRPATCNVGCAAVVLPFFEDCSTALGKYASDFDGVVTLCHTALGDKGRRLQARQPDTLHRRVQMGGDYLHQTIDTHAVCGLGSTDPGCTAARQTKQQTRLLIGRDDIEAIASDKFTATPVEERTMKTAPTLDEMLVADTPANALLSSAFIDEQQPQVTFPVDVTRGTDGCSAGGRRLQTGGDRLHITIETHAATPTEAHAAVQRLADSNRGVICPPSSTHDGGR
jgi:hypothetical protein